MAYEEANFTVRREESMGEVGAATTEYAKFRTFQKSLLKRVHAVVTVAGTTTAHALSVFHGTASVGSIALGTATAGSVACSAILNEPIASYDQISVKTLADAAGKAHIIFEHQRAPDGTRTA